MTEPLPRARQLLASVPHRIRRLARPLYRATVGPWKVRRYIATMKRSGRPIRLVFGGHWCEAPGWLVLSERDQDITVPLHVPDASVDVVFIEHVLEHIELRDALGFLVEARRILRPGGILRIVCPTLDAMLDADLTSPDARTYLGHTIAHAYDDEEAFVRSLSGESLVETAPQILLLNFMFYGHGHRFIWSRDLLIAAARWAGFDTATECRIGEGRNPDVCIERRRRGIYLGNVPAEDRAPGTTFDSESSIVEAIR